MGVLKGKAEGGSGGNRGHSNMDHWGYTDEVKAAARKRRRLDAKEIIAGEMADGSDEARERLPEEGSRATRMLRGEVVKSVRRNRPGERCIEFADGTRLFIDAHNQAIELSLS